MHLFTTYAIFTLAMNKANSVNIQGRFEAEALRILRNVPGLSVTQCGTSRTDDGGDAIIEAAGAHTPVAIEVKRRANAATAWQIVRYAQAHPDIRFLLITEEATAEAREILAQHGVALIDGLGNVHLELPGLLFHLEAKRPRARRTIEKLPARLSGKAGIAAQALLLDEKRAWQVHGLAKEAEISVGLAHRVLTRLEAEGIMTSEGTGPSRVRRLTDPAALLDLWAEETIERPTRMPCYALAQTPKQLIEKLGANLTRSGIAYALTGAAAASLVAPFVTAMPIVEVWVNATADPTEMYTAAEVEPVEQGQNVVFLQSKDDAPLAFRRELNGLWLVNLFRLYADLRRDPRRGREQADNLRREAIGF